MFRTISRLSRLTIVAAITLLALLWLANNAQSKVQEQAAIAVEPQSPVDPLVPNPVVWSSLATPIYPVKGTDGRIHLVYGLNVTNSSHYDVRLTSIEVLDGRENPITGTSKVVSNDGKDVIRKAPTLFVAAADTGCRRFHRSAGSGAKRRGLFRCHLQCSS